MASRPKKSASKDPTEAMRLKASSYPGVDQGTSCTQSSFKAGGKAFLYVGMQGGRYKAMFKLQESAAEAAKLAKAEPDDYQVGSTAWVTARFSAEKPMPKALWTRWLDESFRLCGAKTKSAKKAAPKKKVSKKKAAKKAAKKTAAKKKATKKPASKKKAAKTRASRKKAT